MANRHWILGATIVEGVTLERLERRLVWTTYTYFPHSQATVYFQLNKEKIILRIETLEGHLPHSTPLIYPMIPGEKMWVNLKIFFAYIRQRFYYYPQEIQRKNVVCKFGLETTRKTFQTLDLLCDRKVTERRSSLEQHSDFKILCRLSFLAL
jgi:hypothetical protein